ncbi:MAG: sigma-70 family RNA polymerase sigma factor [Phycisphaerae bacterium]|nr:sigma-70 family RNA polymerase sigma factor [Phycisphaerae bacterium]
MSPDPSSHDPSASATNWSLLHAAAAGGEESRASLEAVVQRYWGPIFAFVRATGQPPQDAVDLTQGFVADVLLGRSLLASADRKRGKFRSLLRQSVVNYVRDRVRHDRSQKRQPSTGTPQQGSASKFHELAASSLKSAERAFDAHWAAQVIRTAAERAQARARREGRELAWTVFERRTLRPRLRGDRPTEYSELIDTLPLQSIGQAAHLAIMGRRLFVDELLAELRGTLGEGESVDDEIRLLIDALEGS